MRSSLLIGLLGVAAIAASAADAKTFRYSTTGDILGLDPHINNEGPTNAMKDNIYGRLLHRLPDLSVEPDLATGWELADDGVTWRFNLREGVTFHNGNPFNADDVVYSFERQNQDASEMSFALASIEELRKVDDYTIEIVTKGPDPILLLNLPFLYIVDQEYMEENDANEVVRGAGKTNFANTNANGTGPFKVVEWVQDNRIVLEPFEGWWNQDNRTDNIDQAIFTPIANDATRVAALLSGEIDLIYPVPLQDIARLEGGMPASRCCRRRSCAPSSSASTSGATSCSTCRARARTRSRTSACARRSPMRSISKRSSGW
jgi:peptide/nickel transport system substrate-binding protein